MPLLATTRDRHDGCCPGFCARCNQSTPVRLGAGSDSVEALCGACADAQRRDRAMPAGHRPLRRTA
jgi:hypothetical protein